jgi:hypothetical protein
MNSSVHDKNTICLKVLTTAYDSTLGECSDQGHYICGTWSLHAEVARWGHCFVFAATAGSLNFWST